MARDYRRRAIEDVIDRQRGRITTRAATRKLPHDTEPDTPMRHDPRADVEDRLSDPGDARRSRDDRTRVLKHGETFAVFDRFGDIQPLGVRRATGLYHDGTRYLSRCELRLDGDAAAAAQLDGRARTTSCSPST